MADAQSLGAVAHALAELGALRQCRSATLTARHVGEVAAPTYGKPPTIPANVTTHPTMEANDEGR
jgi:hypothetical protein